MYKTTNLITGEFYIGLHRTHKLSDDYIGSGVDLHKNIKQYGLPNFHKEVLAVYTNEQDMIDQECLLISQTINNPLSLNIKECS
ncbi:MAG: hypothetical protein K0U41_09365 [Gammaproteobacteria bacterium]|nr:hypothetical protein [Gammaproteobacteria bacterium]